jgi:VWFA-related protein
MVYSPVRFLRRFILLAGLPVLGVLFCTQIYASQESQSDKSADGMKIKVGVDEVRLDVVVVDGKGRQITDLTADDFEIYQDRKQQEITSVRYINQDLSSLVNKIDKSSKPDTLIPVPTLKREEVRRTIVFLVNDLYMGFEEVYRTRMSLNKYIKEQMQPGDLISIFKTSRGTATLQAFTSDRRELLARVENIQWGTSWEGEGNFKAEDFREEWASYWNRQGPDRSIEESRISSEFNRIWESEGIIDEDRVQSIAIKYCIKALENLPGRKYLVLISPDVGLPKNPSFKTMRIDVFMQPGDYVLQLFIRDGYAKEKQNLTAQTLDFRVITR